MALEKRTDSVGREAWVDTSTDLVFTEGGTNPTNLEWNAWNRRQLDRWGEQSTPEDFIETIFQGVEGRIKDETSFIEQYTEDNPFVFDEVLAKDSATAEYSPYYQELLEDYLGEIDLKRETVQDDRKLTQELFEFDTRAETRDYQRAVRKAEQGYSDRGLYFSGQRETTTGELKTEFGESRGRGESVYGARERGFGRQEKALDMGESRQRRDIGREEESAIEGGVLQRRGEAISQYNVPLVQSYSRRFPSSTSPALQGYLVPNEFRL